jgi:RimJ/RimL family protein N-acetyltransferase
MRPPASLVTLRPTAPADLEWLLECQQDPASNALAGTKPRDRAEFFARWDDIFRDPAAARVTPRVILAGGVLAGQINVFPQEGTDSIGYWIGREHWGRGIATRAIALLLAEVATRPLYARAAAHNTPSWRALQRNGFVECGRHHAPETERSVEREMITLVLRG